MSKYDYQNFIKDMAKLKSINVYQRRMGWSEIKNFW
jgi:hypothetical protein